MSDLNSFDDATLNDVIRKAKDWALLHGITARSKTNFSADSVQILPFILLPTRVPRREYEKAIHLQPIFNELMNSVAHDTEFLRKTLANTIKADEFTRNLFNIYERVLAENGSVQGKPSLGLFRSDYMLHSFESNEIKQVELQTVSTGFAGLSSQLTQLHRYVLSELNHDNEIVNLPENNALAGFCEALIRAWDLQSNPNAAILIVVKDDFTYNICDHRMHEFYIRKMRPEIKIIRRSLTQINQNAKLGPNNELFINDREVSVVYFRIGYMPRHYPSQNEWDARYLLEKSATIKCPSIQYHLAGTKKVQQVLAKPGILRRFLNDDLKVKAITNTFTGLYSMDSGTEDGQNAFQMALNDPTKYVLKPQREGGGNNIFGHDIPDALHKMSEVERSAWILMERIFPPTTKGYMIRPNDQAPPTLVDLVSELGIYGAVIGDKNGIIHNSHCGHVLRTKLEKSNEGGVAAGYGALDSPYLFNE